MMERATVTIKWCCNWRLTAVLLSSGQGME